MLLTLKIVLFTLCTGVVLTVGLALVFMLWSPTWRARYAPFGLARRQAREAFDRGITQHRLAAKPSPHG